MLRISKPQKPGQAAEYFKSELSRNGVSSEVQSGKWAGRGAGMLGLRGPVSEEDFRRLLDGRDPRTGDVLGSQGGSNRIGSWDLTFAAPKSVSLATLVGGDMRIAEAHRNAVDCAFQIIEAYARGRNGTDDKLGVRTRNLVAAQFTHTVSRALDPHLHTHCVVANLTMTDRGWRALRAPELFRLQRLGTKAYRTALANHLELLGYEVTVGRDRAVEIASITREQIDHFATRHREIVEHRSDGGAWSAERDRLAQVKTRTPKRDVTADELTEMWAAAAAACGLDADRVVAEACERAPSVSRLTEGDALERAFERMGTVTEAADLAVRSELERESVTTETALVERCLDHFFGKFFPQEIVESIDRMRAAGDIIDLMREDPATGGLMESGQLTTPHVIALERDITRWMRDGQRSCEALSGNPDVGPRPEDPRGTGHLNHEQTAAALGLLRSRDRIVGVQGFAGVGKTFMLKRVIREAERAGHTVVCLAPYTSHVDALAGEEIAGRTVASHLRGGVEDTPGQLWVVDEAGTIDTGQMHSLLANAVRVGARVILLGDERQHQAVNAGSPFRLLRRAGMQIEELANIQRQKEPELLWAVRDAARGRLPDAVRRLKSIGHDNAAMDANGRLLDADGKAVIPRVDRRGRRIKDAPRPLAAVDYRDAEGNKIGARQGSVVEIRDSPERFRAIAREYCKHVANPKSVLCIAPSNRERIEINEAVRAMLREAGHIGEREHSALVLRNSGVGESDRKLALNYHPGQRVFYSKKSRRYGIRAKSFATVVEVNRRDNLVTVRRDSGGEITYNPKELYGVTTYDVEPRGFSIGDRIQYRAPDDSASKRVPNGALGRITAIDSKGVATIMLDTARRGDLPSTIDLSRSVQIDHGYAVTSHSSQGKTVERVFVSVDSVAGSAALVNRELGYVATSRARLEATIFTNDLERLETSLDRHRAKVNAHDYRAGKHGSGAADFFDGFEIKPGDGDPPKSVPPASPTRPDRGPKGRSRGPKGPSR